MSLGLNREEVYLKFWLRGEGLIREGGLLERGLIERGLNRAFTVLVFYRITQMLGH